MTARAVRTMIAFAILVVLHYTVRPLMAWRAAPDFMVLALLLAAVRLRPGTAAILGFVMGLTVDSVSLGPLGGAALAMGVVGFTASWLKSVVFADDLRLNAFFFFVGKLAFDVLYVPFQRHGGGAEVIILLMWSLLAALLTAIVGIVVLVMLRPILEPSPA